MSTLIKKARIIDPKSSLDLYDDVYIDSERIEISPKNIPENCLVIDAKGYILAPGLIDLHVHFREPGFCYKEDIRSGIKAAWAGGVTSALVMPNTEPAIDNPKAVAYQLKRAKPLDFDLMVAGAGTLGQKGIELSDIASLVRAGVRAFTDDGKAVLSDSHMEELLRFCRRYNAVFMQHAEDPCISHFAPMHEGSQSKRLGVLGQPHKAESSIIARDLALAERIGARYHALHISCEESLKLIAQSKRRGALVSSEVSPHHLLLCDQDIPHLDSNKKMNPPLRSYRDKEALIEGINDGTIDAVASDHAPHSMREKSRPFSNAPFGVVGVETAIIALLSLAKNGYCSINRAISLMSIGPATILQEEHRIGTLFGLSAQKNACLLDPDFCQLISNKSLHGRSKNSAFIGMELWGHVIATFQNGRMVYRARGN